MGWACWSCLSDQSPGRKERKTQCNGSKHSFFLQMGVVKSKTEKRHHLQILKAELRVDGLTRDGGERGRYWKEIKESVRGKEGGEESQRGKSRMKKSPYWGFPAVERGKKKEVRLSLSQKLPYSPQDTTLRNAGEEHLFNA